MSYAAVMDGNVSDNTKGVSVWEFDVTFPLGVWRVTASLKGVRQLEWLQEPIIPIQEGGSLPSKLKDWQQRLQRYLNGEIVAIDQIPVDWSALSGTEFQKRCWLGLLTIPYGTTQSYGWLAEQVGSPKAVRAVGQANGHNPVPLIIPCHRVIAANGKLTGFMRGREGGTDVKAWLLALESDAAQKTLEGLKG